MQKNTTSTATKNYTITLSRKGGKTWMIEDISPLGKPFEKFFDENLDHDISKLTFISAVASVLDNLADGAERMDVDLRTCPERQDLPGYVEFALSEPGILASRYFVNNCPGRPQLVAWLNASVRRIFREFPAFAYLRKK